jgi:hypothetical protein
MCLKNGSMRGLTWSTDTLIKAYKIRLICGSTGYDVLRKMGLPRIEHFKFAPGLLNEI